MSVSHRGVVDSPVQAAEALRARVFAAISGEPSLTRPERRTQSALFFGAAVIVSLAIFFASGGVRGAPRPWLLMLATAAGTALLAACSSAVAASPGSARLTRPRGALWAAIALLPLALLLWKTGASALVEGMRTEWPSRAGFRCLRLGLLTGAAPLVAALFAFRRSDPVHPFSLGAALGASTGMAAAVLVDLWCPVAYLPHLLLGHLLPIGALAIAGALGGFVLRPQARA